MLKRKEGKTHKLFYKVLFSFLCVSIIPIVLFCGYTIIFTQNTAQQNISNILVNEAKSSTASFNKIISYYKGITENLCNDSALQEIMKDIESDKANEQQLYNYIYRVRSENGYMPIVCIVNRDREIAASVGLPSSYNVNWDSQHESLYALSDRTQNDTICSPCCYSLNGGTTVVISIMHQIKINNSVIGYVFIDLSESSLKYALTADKEVAAGSNYAKYYIIYTWYNYVVYSDYFSGYSHGVRHLDLGFRDEFKTDDPVVTSYQDGNTTLQMAGMQTADGKFVVAVIVPTDLVIQNNSYILRGALLFFVLSIVLCSILAVYLTSSFTKPVQDMVDMMREVEKGDLSIRVRVRRNDEMGALARQLNITVQKMDELFKRDIEKQKLLFVAELNNLQAQIRPHFIYNALDSIKYLAKLNENDKVCDVTTSLGLILRKSFNQSNEMETVGESLRLIENYLSIFKVIYPDKMNAQINVDSDCLDVKIPTFLLQPIVENAVIHGLEPRVDAGKVVVRIYKAGLNVVINVWDNGIGIPKEKLETILDAGPKITTGKDPQHGYGLYNVNKRIKLQYGPQYHLQIDSVVNEYTSVTVVIPYN